jgi:hypothetical protein
MSMVIAVWPVTPTVMPVCVLMAGAAARMALTSRTVSTLLGALFGMTFRIAVSPAALNTAGGTRSTSSSLVMSLATVCAAVLASLVPDASSTTVNGPLKPGPKPAASRS